MWIKRKGYVRNAASRTMQFLSIPVGKKLGIFSFILLINITFVVFREAKRSQRNISLGKYGVSQITRL